MNTGFTIWFTGLPGTGKSTLSSLVKKALIARGHKVEIINSQTLSYWLKHELHIEEDIHEDRSHVPGYDAFITYICTLLARNGIITITVSVSPSQEARTHAREHIQHFIEVYLHCPPHLRHQRLEGPASSITEQVYQPPSRAELSIDTSLELPERSALRIIAYLEQCGYVAPIWEGASTSDEEEIELVKARLQALGYLE